MCQDFSRPKSVYFCRPLEVIRGVYESPVGPVGPGMNTIQHLHVGVTWLEAPTLTIRDLQPGHPLKVQDPSSEIKKGTSFHGSLRGGHLFKAEAARSEPKGVNGMVFG